MFTIIKNLANLSENKDLDINDFLEYPGSKSCTQAKFLLFEKEVDKFIYKGLSDTEELDQSKNYLYLYPKSRPARGTGKTPTIKYQDYERSYKQKIFDWFQNNKDKNILFKIIFNALISNEEAIKNDLSQINKNIFLSIKINNKYIGDFEEFKALIISEEEIINDISSKYGLNDVILKNVNCAVCLKNDIDAYGFTIPSPYTFGGVDSVGFSYEFNQKSAVKQFPVCLDCAKDIRGSGLNFLEDNLRFRLSNADYFLIPELVYNSEENITKLRKIIKELNKARADFNLYSEKNYPKLKKPEECILRILEKEDYLTLNLFFYKQDQKKFNILANIEEVLPSNLRKIYQIADKINSKFEENQIVIHTKKEEKSIKFSFDILSNIFENQDVRIDKRSKREFFEVLNKIMTLRPISYNYLMNKFMEKVYKYSPDFIQGQFYKLKETIFESFLLLNILLESNLIKIGEEKNTMAEINTPTLDEFCSNFSEFFHSPLKKAIFGLGLLTENLAYLQYKERNNKSIYKDLRNFKVDQKFLKEKLYPKLHSKLDSYKKQIEKHHLKGFTDTLIKEVSLLLEKDNTSLTTGEASYVFVLGINLYENFKNKYFEKNRKNAVEVKELQKIN